MLLAGKAGCSGIEIVDSLKTFVVFDEDFTKEVVGITDVVFVVVALVCKLQTSLVSMHAFNLHDVLTEGNLESALAVLQQHTLNLRRPLLLIRRDVGNISKALLEMDDTMPKLKLKYLRLLSPLKVSSLKCCILLSFKIKTSKLLRSEKAPSAIFKCCEP